MSHFICPTRSKISVLLFLVFMTFSGARLQAQAVGGGLTGGITSSQIDGDAWGGYNFWGYQLGGFATYSFNDRIGLQIEILNSYRGSREAGISRIALQFIDVPIIFRFRKETAKGDLDGEFGLSGNLLLSGKTGLRGFTFDQTENFRRLSSELHLGGAFYLAENAGLFARWSLSLSNLQSDPQLRPWLTIHYFTAGLRIRLK